MCGLEDENHLQEFVQREISYNKHMIIRLRMFIGIQMFVNTNEVFELK